MLGIHHQANGHKVTRLCGCTRVQRLWPFVAFLCQPVSFQYLASLAPSLACICVHADEKLFNSILDNDKHLLHLLLVPVRTQHYSINQSITLTLNLLIPVRTRQYSLTAITTSSFQFAILHFNNNNFLIIMLFNDFSYSTQSSSTM